MTHHRTHRSKVPTAQKQPELEASIEASHLPSALAKIAAGCIDDSPRLAARAYRKALQIGGEDPVLRNNLGVALWNQGNRGEALDAFRKAAAVLSNDANVVENLAGMLLDGGDPEQARRWFTRAADLKRGDQTLLAYVDLHGY